MTTEETSIEYWIDKSRTFRKSIILFKQVGTVASPIMYFTKPKFISDDDFLKIFDQIELRIKNKDNANI